MSDLTARAAPPVAILCRVRKKPNIVSLAVPPCLRDVPMEREKVLRGRVDPARVGRAAGAAQKRLFSRDRPQKKIGGNALSRMDAFQTLLESVSGRSLPRADKASKLPPIFNKALLDQIVRYCRVVTKTDGEKEIELELNEKIFQGLRLRVSSKDGEMLATFETRSPEAHALFQAHKNDLKQVLQEKGIAVRSINVIMV